MLYYDNITFDKHIEYEVYILKKYLTKYYGEDKALILLKKYSNRLDDLAKALGEKDIAFFNLYFLSDIFVPQDGNSARTLSQSHYEMFDLLNDTFVKDLYDKINIVVSRGWAKTTTGDLSLTVWAKCYKKSLFSVIGAKTDNDAQQFISSIRNVFTTNKKIIKVFGALIDDKRRDLKSNANEIELTNGTCIRAIGSGTSLRGINWKSIRPTMLVMDDFQSEINILTDDARVKQYNKWTKEVEQCGDKAVFRNGKKIKSATKIVSIGTVLHIDCLISRLIRNKDYKTFLRRAIILEDGQTVDDIFDSPLWSECKRLYFNDKFEDSKSVAKAFYEEHKEEMKFPVLWEEKWDCFNDLAIPYWENRQAFMSEMMNDATSIGEKWFKSVRTQSKEEIENHTFIKTMLCVDPASTTNKKSDYTAMVVGSQATNSFKYMRELVLDKFEFNKYCEKVVELLLLYDEITHIYIEKNTFQGADVVKIKELIAKEPKLKNKRYEWMNEMQRTNKDEKISTIIDNVNNGQVIFIDNNKEFLDLLLEFQGQKYTLHDDSADITAECVNRLDKIIKNNKIILFDRNKIGV
ncbi:MAG: terminase [Peptostreptococcaceae bacterium]|nr:terminase [Peptostreptococcaceae bacterium]